MIWRIPEYKFENILKEFIVDKNYSGGRLDKIIFNYLDKAPKGFVYKMLRKKNIVLNDKKAIGNEILKSGDIIKFYFSDETIDKFHSDGFKISDSNIDISKLICFEDENIVAFNKPCGMLSQKSEIGDVSLNDLLLEYLNNEFVAFTPGIANRLDRNTSGIVLAGKNLNASRCLNEIIKERRLSKHYYCIVDGVIENEKVIDGFLLKDNKTNKVTILNEHTPKASKIITAYKPIISNEKYCLLDVDLVTGKSHQIRAHLASISHPIIGDNKYGKLDVNRYFMENYGLKWQLLHAREVNFKNVTNDLSYLNGKSITAGFPKIFIDILKGEKLWQPGIVED